MSANAYGEEINNPTYFERDYQYDYYECVGRSIGNIGGSNAINSNSVSNNGISSAFVSGDMEGKVHKNVFQVIFRSTKLINFRCEEK